MPPRPVALGPIQSRLTQRTATNPRGHLKRNTVMPVSVGGVPPFIRQANRISINAKAIGKVLKFAKPLRNRNYIRREKPGILKESKWCG